MPALRFTPAQLGALLGGGRRRAPSPPTRARTCSARCSAPARRPRTIIAEKGLAQVSDTGAIEAVVDEVLAKNAGEVEKYRAGKKQVFGFFVGPGDEGDEGQGQPRRSSTSC